MKSKILKFTSAAVGLFIIGGIIGLLVQPSTNIYSKANFLDSDITTQPASLDADITENKTVEHKSAPVEDKETPKEAVPAQTSAPTPTFSPDPNCVFEMPSNGTFSAQPVKNILSIKIGQNQKARMALFFENTGNIPWFSSNSKCQNAPKVSLGTTRTLDRQSVFLNGNRVTMQEEKIEPGQIASFEFEINSPSESDIYREFFALTVEGKTWMKDSEIMIDFHVGNITETQESIDKKTTYIPVSMKFSELDLTAEKTLEVDLSEQKMYIKIGDKLVRIFRTSTGKAETPTPTGNYNIEFKQQVRIAGGGTPYIMPKWQRIHEGVGIHALPSLGNATLRHKILQLEPDEDAPTEWFKDDSLWTEAVDHIGRPVSHGCVRLLPDDADFLFDFTEIGTPIAIRY